MAVSPREPRERSSRRQDIEKAKIYNLSRQLQTNLKYAQLKVDHGWTKQNINEVENLYFMYRNHQRHQQQTSAPPRPSAARQRSQAQVAALASAAAPADAATGGGTGATQPLQSSSTTQRNGSVPNGAAPEDAPMDVDEDSDDVDEAAGDDMVTTADPSGSVPVRPSTPPRLDSSALPRTPAQAAPRGVTSAPPLSAARPALLGSPVTVTPPKTRAPSKASTPLPAFPAHMTAAITAQGRDPGVLQAALAGRPKPSNLKPPNALLTSPFASSSLTNGNSKTSTAAPLFSSGSGLGLNGKATSYDSFWQSTTRMEYSSLINSPNPAIAAVAKRLKDIESPSPAETTPTPFTSALPSATIPYGSNGAGGSASASALAGSSVTAAASTTPPVMVNPAEAMARAARLGVSRRPSPTPEGSSTRATRRTSAPRQLR